MNKQTAKNINTLASFLGKRDIVSLTQDCLLETYGFPQVDVAVLFGGSILEGANTFAEAMKNKIAKRYIIVGGAGHTTDTLREYVHSKGAEIEVKNKSEAEIFHAYLKKIYGLQVDYLETQSTNCGNNITYLLDLLKREKIECKSILLSQDATMQYRMEATLRKYTSEDLQIINYATYQTEVLYQPGTLVYSNILDGMWNMERYINLLMGEIPRLRDDENGYGPKGANFIASVKIPKEVEDAYAFLVNEMNFNTREANPLYASK